MKKRIVFYDHSFHEKTKSNGFFMDLLTECYEIKTILDDSWDGKSSPPDIESINKMSPDCIIFWQMSPSLSQIDKIKCDNKIWIPMWDSWVYLKPADWRKYLMRHIKIVAFCKRLYHTVAKYNSASYYFQYCPSPEIREKKRDGKIRIYFWQRVSNINWEVLKTLIGSNRIEKIYFKNHPDPGYEIMQIPSQEDITKYNIQFIDNWLPWSEYLLILNECNVFFAPRALEGIGLANLEAMSNGMCLVSPDQPTANEYIENGKNGLLYDLNKPQCLDLSQVDILGENAKEYIRRGFEKWSLQKEKIFDIIEKPYSNHVIKNIRLELFHTFDLFKRRIGSIMRRMRRMK